MKLGDIIEPLSLDVKTGSSSLGRAVTGVYVSDLLSDVMANSGEGNVWITLQTHLNIVAVAGLKNLAGIIVVSGRNVPADVLQKAEVEKVTVMTTQLPAFETAGKLYQMLYA